MTHRTVMLILASMLIVPIDAPAHAGVNVGPDLRAPRIRIEAEKVTRQGGEPRPVSNPSTSGDPVPTPTVACKVDEVTGVYGCRTYRPAEPEGDPRELTDGDILRAAREVGLPRLEVTIEPGDSTLVNADTNFYTDPEAFARSVDLLGFDVDLQASPVRFTWIHGDGTRRTTAKPGRPYPDLDVTHRYRKPAEVVRPRVDVTYRVRYRVDGGAWATLGQTLTASGPTTDLTVNEAAPVLTAP